MPTRSANKPGKNTFNSKPNSKKRFYSARNNNARVPTTTTSNPSSIDSRTQSHRRNRITRELTSAYLLTSMSPVTKFVALAPVYRVIGRFVNSTDKGRALELFTADPEDDVNDNLQTPLPQSRVLIHEDDHDNDNELQTPLALLPISSIPTSADPYVQSEARAPLPSQYPLQLFLTSPPSPPPPNNPVSSSPQPPSTPTPTRYNWTFHHSKTLLAWEQNPRHARSGSKVDSKL
ncbi:MAG: hypothetical protein NXY57DRAFT_979705 [Lentinula lateritia]|nr:MAG: hypothetical protein NXY57DRAFT_979705 [Lentinula lateritia]